MNTFALLLTTTALASLAGHAGAAAPDLETAKQPADMSAEIHCDAQPRAQIDRTTYETVSESDLRAIMNITESGIYGKAVGLPIHGGVITQGVLIDGFEYPLGGWYGWGLLDDKEGGYFAVAVKGEAIQATIYRGTKQYGIRKPAAVGKDKAGQVMFEVASTPAGQDIKLMPGYELMREKARNRGVVENSIIDHLYVYSSGLESGIGDFDGDGVPNTRDDGVARMMLSVSELSLIYIASDIQATARLAYAYASNIPDNYLPSLSELSGNDDGYVDELSEVRDLVKADLGSYKRYVGGGVGGGATAWAYTGFREAWLTRGAIGNQTIGGGNGHEIGHSMGMAHSRNGTLTAHIDIPYAYGYCVGPVANRSTLMTGGCPTANGPVLLQYSNPNLKYSVTGEAMGIDHDIDPTNSADGARAQNVTAPIVAGFRTGVPEYPDCDGDGVLDIIEIAYGTASDCNGNGIDDACDISSGFETDCDSNGIPDSCEFSSELFIQRTESSQISNSVTSRTFVFDSIPSVDSTLHVRFSTGAALTNVQSIDVYVDGVFADTILESGPTNTSCGTSTSDSFDYLAHDGDVQSVQIVVNGGSLSDGFLCIASASITLEYHTEEPNDINRNGVYDPCEPCSPYDVTADGLINFVDVSLYSNWYINGNLLADFAAPYGELNYFDLSAFLDGYSEGCP